MTVLKLKFMILVIQSLNAILFKMDTADVLRDRNEEFIQELRDQIKKEQG